MPEKKSAPPILSSEGTQRGRSSGLRFDFDKPASGAPEPGGGIRTSGIDRGAKANPADFLDRAFSREASPAATPHLESVPLNRTAAAPSASRTENAGGNFWEPRKAPPAVEFPGTRFIVNQDAGAIPELPAASLGHRFLSGVFDLLILMAAAALFCGLFVAVGGRIERYPLAAAIGGFIALVWIFFYFGLFTAVALKTPGQSAMGLAVRNLEGEVPTRQEAMLRAFGYEVSILALMAGFLWAAMDSDGLSWHDHISGTLLVEERRLYT